jgi:hypothetical protein
MIFECISQEPLYQFFVTNKRTSKNFGKILQTLARRRNTPPDLGTLGCGRLVMMINIIIVVVVVIIIIIMLIKFHSAVALFIDA